jgi:hypothetical protein
MASLDETSPDTAGISRVRWRHTLTDGGIMAKSNRETNEKELREGLTEKARLTAEEVAREQVEEREREDRKHLNDPN